jgi:hypothetical protein
MLNRFFPPPAKAPVSRSEFQFPFLPSAAKHPEKDCKILDDFCKNSARIGKWKLEF